jgi:hypothetical protein
MKRYLVLGAVAVAALAFPELASAQSGHFVGRQSCTDVGLQVECSGKVAGLGGTTFTILVSAEGTASVDCINPGGNVAPGQRFTFTAAGQSGPFPTPRNGQSPYTVRTDPPPDPDPAVVCPNPQWDATITDVAFTTATITLLEDSTVSDTETVPVS